MYHNLQSAQWQVVPMPWHTLGLFRLPIEANVESSKTHKRLKYTLLASLIASSILYSTSQTNAQFNNTTATTQCSQSHIQRACRSVAIKHRVVLVFGDGFRILDMGRGIVFLNIEHVAFSLELSSTRGFNWSSQND